jgi:hypothetical protein
MPLVVDAAFKQRARRGFLGPLTSLQRSVVSRHREVEDYNPWRFETMNDDPFDADVLSLVRNARPEIEQDEVSPAGATARAMLERVVADDRPDSPTGGGVRRGRSRRGRASAVGRATHVRRPFTFPLVGAALAAIVATVAVALPRQRVGAVALPTQGAGAHGSVPRVGPSLPALQLAAVRSRVLTALESSAADVLRIDTSFETAAARPQGVCPVVRWVAPVDAHAGQEFREVIESAAGCGPEFAKGIDIPNPTVTTVGPNTPSSGQHAEPVDAQGVYARGAGTVSTLNAANHTWRQTHVPDLEAYVGPTPDLTRAQLQVGTLAIVGHTIINDRPTIELAVSDNKLGAFTLWVDQTTYLPVRRSLHSSNVVEDYAFLPPTAANIARVQLTQPAGYTVLSPTASGGAASGPGATN